MFVCQTSALYAVLYETQKTKKDTFNNIILNKNVMYHTKPHL